MSQRVFMIIIFVLAGIGLIVSARQFLIPLSVFGVIFLLWKFPPDQWGRKLRNRRRFQQQSRNIHSKPRRKDARNVVEGKFRVIPGSKGQKKDEEDPPPRYH